MKQSGARAYLGTLEFGQRGPLLGLVEHSAFRMVLVALSLAHMVGDPLSCGMIVLRWYCCHSCGVKPQSCAVPGWADSSRLLSVGVDSSCVLFTSSAQAEVLITKTKVNAAMVLFLKPIP